MSARAARRPPRAAAPTRRATGEPAQTVRPTCGPTRARAAASRAPIPLLAVASGLAVASVYYVQPLLDAIAHDFGMSHAAAGIVFTTTQAGYGLGLLLLAPLGDRLDPRRLLVGQSLLLAAALTGVALARSSAAVLLAFAAVGMLAVIAQVSVAYAAFLAPASERGRAVGAVTSGIVGGILLARTGAGALSDFLGWRGVYLLAALGTLASAALLMKALRRQPRPAASTRLAFLPLLGSIFALFAAEPVLRIRAMLALLVFAAVTTLLTPMVLALTAPPFVLSHAEVGWFGLSGVAGMVGARCAGRLSDRGHAQRATGVGLACMLFSWLPSALLPFSPWGLVIGCIAIDFGLQAVHVANQNVIYRVRPQARSRIAAGYMVFYSAGCAIGAIASTTVYAQAGWHGVCVLGAALSAAALGLRAATRRVAGMAESHP
jgi:predicted MFS family arabinose efflux permease